MWTADDHIFGGLPRDLTCPACEHLAHAGYCLDDLIEGVRCPCHCPIPGSGR